MNRSAFLVAVLAIAAWLLPRDAGAFCGFYVSGADAKLFNNATLVVMMRDGQRTVLSMQNNYQGPPQDFAMVVPVPVVLSKSNVKTLPRDIFERVDQLTAPRLVEYWEEDPCAPRSLREEAAPAPMEMEAPTGAAKSESHGVKIEAKFTVGEYEILILSANDSAGLDLWLHENHYRIPDGAEPLLRPYVQMGMKFFVAKVDATKVKMERGQAMLSPLRFHYDSDSFFLPVRLGLVNSAGTQDLIVHILARGQRYEVANYPNVAIPTNLDVSERAKSSFATMYAALFDRTIENAKNGVVTEYAWDASSCDPCPTPSLTPEELMTLGADALPSSNDESGSGPNDFVVTRLHLRYKKDSFGDDLFFRTAPPIVGGREFMQEDGKLERGARSDTTNNFQARYVIRHPWKGPIACEHPQRGIWGGPPAGDTPVVQPALNLAFAARDADLGDFLKDREPQGSVLSPAGPTPLLVVPKGGGCAGCSVHDGGDEIAGAIVCGLGFAIVLRRSRRRKVA
jgi:hypothetical protein